MSFRLRLILGYGMLLILLAGFGGVSLQQLTRVRAANQRLIAQTERALAAESFSRASQELVRIIQEGILLEDVQVFRDRVPAALEEVNVRYADLTATYGEGEPLPGPLLFAKVNLQGVVQPLITQAEAESWSTMPGALSTASDNLQRISETIAQIVQEAQDSQVAARSEAQGAQQTMYQVLLVGFVVALFLSGYVTFATQRSISRSVANLSEGAARLASGELDTQVTPESRDDLGKLAVSFNQMAEQLKALYGDLEARIAERTAEQETLNERLRLSAEVGQAVTSILDTDRLVAQIAQLIYERFGLYHVGLFELDKTGQWAIYRAGAGTGAEALLQQDFRLEVGGNSIIGWATGNGEVRIAGDVSLENWRLDHPLVPDTRSEAALPLIARGRVIGALSVQSDRVGGIDQGMVAVLQLLADQVAVALSNAQLFEQVQESMEAERRAYGEVSRDAWRQILQERLVGYHFDQRGVAALQELPEEDLQSSSDLPELHLPVRVRGAVIGALHAHKAASETKWTDEEVALLKTLVEQLGTALDGARLYQDTQQRAARERFVGEVATRMRQTLDIEAVLQSAVRELGRLPGVAEAAVHLKPISDATTPRDGDEG